MTCVELIKCKAVNLLLGSNGTIQRKSLMLTDHQDQGEHCWPSHMTRLLLGSVKYQSQGWTNHIFIHSTNVNILLLFCCVLSIFWIFNLLKGRPKIKCRYTVYLYIKTLFIAPPPGEVGDLLYITVFSHGLHNMEYNRLGCRTRVVVNMNILISTESDTNHCDYRGLWCQRNQNWLRGGEN